MVKDVYEDDMYQALRLKQHQFIQHLFTGVGDTVVTMAHAWDSKKMGGAGAPTAMGRLLSTETFEVLHLCE